MTTISSAVVAVAWLDETTVAVWGEGDENENLTPAALIYDADTGELLRRFDGPARGLRRCLRI